MTTSWLVYVLIGDGILLLLALVIGIITNARKNRDIDNRIDRFTGGASIKPTEEEKKAIQQNSPVMTTWLNDRVGQSSFGEGISRDLARANMKLKTGEYLAVMIIAAFGMGVVMWFILGQQIVMGIVGMGIGFFLPRFYVKGQQKKRLQKFNEQLSDMLNLMVNGLRAGYSTMQAMQAVSKEMPSPINEEFHRVVQEMQLGVSMQVALDNLHRRIPSDDLDLVITAINVQREVGGNLAEILDTISFTIRERVRIKGEIRVLTTQVMYSGRILSLMPVFVMGILYVINRDYIMEYFNPANNTPLPCGWFGLSCSAILIAIGYVVMNKIGQIEV